MSNIKKLSSIVFECSVFTVRSDNYFISKINNTYNFFIIEPSDWANIIAITDNGEVILVKQYRYGREAFTLEIPGGMIDKGETPETAARRELLEETGYRAKNFQLIGIADPNPAIQSNKCHMFLATGIELTGVPHLDSTEEIEIIHIPLSQIPSMIEKGEITHSLVITAFYYYSLLNSNN